MNWRESWLYILSWAGFLGAVIVAVRQTYAAERDRKALQLAKLEQEKLELEVRALRNTPEAMRDRRKLYDELRRQVQIITGTATADASQVVALQELKHDFEYRFPAEVVNAIQRLIKSVGTICWSSDNLRRGREQSTTYEKWEKVVKTNSDALLEVVGFEKSMVELFRPYLTL